MFFSEMKFLLCPGLVDKKEKVGSMSCITSGEMVKVSVEVLFASCDEEAWKGIRVVDGIFLSCLNLCFLHVVPDRNHSESAGNEEIPVRSYSRYFFFTFGSFRSPVGSIPQMLEDVFLTFVFFHEKLPFFLILFLPRSNIELLLTLHFSVLSIMPDKRMGFPRDKIPAVTLFF